MAVTFAEVKALIDGTIGSLKDVTIEGDSTNRGGAFKAGGSGLVIRRDGSVSGSLSGGKISLEGGGIDWEGALNQDNSSPYYTRAQRVMLASLIKYIESMSDANINNKALT